jgi:hypothetical protein
MADKVVNFERARQALMDHVSDNQLVFDRFFALADQYNASLAEAKDHVRAMMPPGPIVVGPFKRSKPPVSVDYLAAKLPDSVKLLPGVIKKIDGDTLDKLVLDGTISGDTIRDARVSVNGTPKIDGPKEVVVKL